MSVEMGPPCPWCGQKTDANHVDNGVGLQRIEPWGCWGCEAWELGWGDAEKLSAEIESGELETKQHPDRCLWVRRTRVADAHSETKGEP